MFNITNVPDIQKFLNKIKYMNNDNKRLKELKQELDELVETLISPIEALPIETNIFNMSFIELMVEQYNAEQGSVAVEYDENGVPSCRVHSIPANDVMTYVIREDGALEVRYMLPTLPKNDSSVLSILVKLLLENPKMQTFFQQLGWNEEQSKQYLDSVMFDIYISLPQSYKEN